ncbi:MAG: SpoIIE family protein phosphatase [Synergistaceae bacterium]|jgi:sigma-B regulation protein RsbU (phosphoserine phosphatase)|nr:SpoIIE family protein phosphatase [Synergistaceae bacterium]
MPDKIRCTLTLKFAALFGIFAVVSGMLICSITYMNYRASMLEHYGGYAAGAAALAASILDPDELARYAETLRRDERYAAIEEELSEIRISLDVKYIYVQMPVSDTEYMFLFDIYDPSEPGAPDPSLRLGARGVYDENFKAAKLAMSTGKPARNLDITHSEYGYLASAYVPILRKGSNVPFAYLGVDISMDYIISFLMRYMAVIASATALVIMLCFTALFSLVRRSVVNPIKAIAEKTGEFARGAADPRVSDADFEELNVRSNDEIGDLTASVNVMFRDIREFTRRLADEMARRERVQSELDMARKIQEDALPKVFPPFGNYPDAEIFAGMIPAKEVGGDFYDLFLVGENKLAVVTADVSGKGVPAALFMMVVRTLIRNRALSGDEPHELLRTVNRQLCENNEACMFVTVFAGILDTQLGVIRYANAGHVPPALLRGGGAFWLPMEAAVALGVMEDADFITQETSFGEGDILLLYTDGVTEAMNEHGELFGERRLFELMSYLARENGDVDAKSIVKAVNSAVHEFAGGAEQADDITILALRRTM